MRIHSMLALAALACTLAACYGREEKTDISHTYKMIDDSGKNAGSVTFGPVGTDGVVRDANGQVVGRVIPPAMVAPH